MNIFNLREKKFFFAWFLIVVLVIFQILPYKKQEGFLFRAVYGAIAELQTIGVNFHLGMKDVLSKYLILLQLNEENAQLKIENAGLQTKNQILKELTLENLRLREVIQFSQRKEEKLLVAQVVANDFLSQNQLITINKGSRHGVKKYMGVIHVKGAVGYIFRVSPHSSQVIPLHNKLSTLPARLQKNRLRGLVEGYQNKELYFKYFNLQSDQSISFQKGEIIVTDSSSRFPLGIPVGEVSSSSRDVKIRIKPYVNISQIEEVFVVLHSQIEEISE